MRRAGACGAAGRAARRRLGDPGRRREPPLRDRFAAYEQLWARIVDGSGNLAYRLALNSLSGARGAAGFHPRAFAAEVDDPRAIVPLAEAIARADAAEAQRLGWSCSANGAVVLGLEPRGRPSSSHGGATSPPCSVAMRRSASRIAAGLDFAEPLTAGRGRG